ncbi:hypothetical protein G3480_14625 [Thiorhodococcus mannitoliphagus]|uniref:Uncharacterized protein n=1 Tax=Thiorhodococcus mannitoliphagus TaxID=329406 RepID=A0A6P1DTU2_9GAMM|nr:hypothetical protein [Thiorhodococcus mannitoliphagus]NEX21528.1 hypothetical protein [Thiorhodococcus mannitoliphagus]
MDRPDRTPHPGAAPDASGRSRSAERLGEQTRDASLEREQRLERQGLRRERRLQQSTPLEVEQPGASAAGYRARLRSLSTRQEQARESSQLRRKLRSTP